MLYKLIFLFPVVFFSQNTVASLIDHGTYITDTASRLDWLKLTETFNRSYDDVSSKFGTGQEFEGWVYATGEQFEALVFNQGATAMTCTNGTMFCGWSADNNGIAAPMINLLGDTGEQQLNGELTPGLTVWTVGILADVHDANSHWEAELYDYDFNPLTSAQDNISTHDTFIDNAILPNYGGSFLVRVSAVPIPGAVWLFGSGLLGLIGMARRRKTV